MEYPDQDYGSSPLNCAVVMRRRDIIRELVQRGANTVDAMDHAQRGLAGHYESDPTLDAKGYGEIVELLESLGVR